MKEQCKGCPYQAIEYLSGGYGMPAREKPYCILEKEHKPCEKIGGFGEDVGESSSSPDNSLSHMVEVSIFIGTNETKQTNPLTEQRTSSTKAPEDIADLPNDSYKPTNIGA